ncbi:ABC transporter substrate-binding protein [Agromyces archimandritae]|uniref:Sugar ABC transporter substrate-binding protein n=1 Tax=Agromyces archimandritae TaxID=2781962 RepID=A0A975FJX3_9MICO|nr:sugar ABC transporter substrate-binding protein [Agromyces archimandritae]QTX03385.1 sugar ABC transporter substrate-binding protein [Agromyces archimandritae]
MHKRHKRFSRITGIIAAVAATSLALAGCSGGGSSGGAEGDPEKGALTFVYMGDADQQKAFNALFAEFNKQYPGIKLKAQGIPSGDWSVFSNTVATRLAGGQKIDIIQVATEGQRLFASKGVLEPLEPFIEQDQDYVDDYFADINPELVEFNEQFASGPDGETLFIPGGFNTMGLYLNKTVFEAAGVPIPEEGNWTWDEFEAAGTQIKEKTGAYLFGAGSGYFTDVMPWLTTNGASTFNDDWSEPTYDSPEAVESAEFVRKLVEEGLAPEPGGQFDAETQYKQGKLASIGGGRWPTIGMRNIDMVDDTVIVNFPTKTGNGSPVGWDAWNIAKKSENKQAAWTFIKFLMSQEAGEYFASIGGTIVPARTSVVESDAFTENAPAGSTRLSDAMAFATPIPSIDRGAEAQKAIQEAWETIITGNGDAADTLAKAQKTLEGLVE